jgi:nucleoside-diphosphate-sugar epimerase
MTMAKVAVVGKNSLIAGALRREEATGHWCFVGHEEALTGTQWLRDVDVVINCAFDPRLKTQAYEAEFDADLKIASLLRDRDEVRYVMLSSRLVYGVQTSDARLTESVMPQPDRPYGMAKLRTEQELLGALGERLTVLRLSNVFGAEYQAGRSNFFAIALRTLLEQGRIVLDMNPAVQRDFIPVESVARALIDISNTIRPGVFNIGAGHGTPTGHIAQWLIEGFGAGQVVVSNARDYDAFWLDIDRARQAFGFAGVPASEIREHCLRLGSDLRALTRRVA